MNPAEQYIQYISGEGRRLNVLASKVRPLARRRDGLELVDALRDLVEFLMLFVGDRNLDSCLVLRGVQLPHGRWALAFYV